MKLPVIADPREMKYRRIRRDTSSKEKKNAVKERGA